MWSLYSILPYIAIINYLVRDFSRKECRFSRCRQLNSKTVFLWRASAIIFLEQVNFLEQLFN